MKINSLYNFFDTCYDFNSQDDWDQSGLISFGGDSEQEIDSVIVTLDINSDVIDFAIKNKIPLIVSHHPILKSTLEDPLNPAHEFVKKLYENKINVISIHTPFDKDVNGMNVALAQKLGLKNIKRLNDSKYVMVGELYLPARLDKYAKQAATLLNSDYVKYNEVFKNKKISKIAICGGSGGSFVTAVAASKEVDAYITCDMKYHTWNDAYELRLPVIDLNHEIENVFINVVAKKVKDFCPFVKVTRFTTHLDTNIIQISKSK